MSSIKTITPRFTSPTKHEDVDIDLDARSSSCTAHNNNNTMHFHSHDSSVSSLVGGTMTTTPTNTYPSRRSHSLHRASASSAAPLLGGGDNDGDLFSSSDRRRHRRLLSGDSTSSTAPLQGVRRVEAIQAVWTDRSRIVLFIGLALASYVYSLDGSTTWQFLFYATSTVFGNSYSGSITTSAAIIIAVGKPFMAKMADVFGRAESFVAVAALYSGGYAIIALSSGISGLAGGTLIYSFGYTGLQLLSQIVIADVTTLRWRGLSSALLSLPFIINNFVAAEIAEFILPDWRYGYALFAIAVPICLFPIVGTMFWAQRRAKKIHHEKHPYEPVETWKEAAVKSCREMDIVGLFLIATSLGLVLLPLTLANTKETGWNNPAMPAMVVMGLLLFVVFCWYESNYPSTPIVPYQFLLNKSILGACLIGFFDFTSFYLQFTNLYNFIYVTQDWSARNLSYFSSIQTMAMTVAGIAGGAIMSRTREVKNLLFVGLLIRLAGVAFMIRSRGANGTPFELVANQVVQGIGGGLASVTLQVSAQAGVLHVDVATVTAMAMLISEIGNSVGSAIATSIYTRDMPKAIALHVPGNNATLNEELYLSPTSARLYPKDDPIRQGIILAYDDIMFKQVIFATMVALVPPVLCYYLTRRDRLEDVQNLVDHHDLAGHPTLSSPFTQDDSDDELMDDDIPRPRSRLQTYQEWNTGGYRSLDSQTPPPKMGTGPLKVPPV